MLCCFVVLTMTTVSVAPSSFRIILGERREEAEDIRRGDKERGEEKWREEGCRRDVRMIGGCRRAEKIIREREKSVCWQRRIAREAVWSVTLNYWNYTSSDHIYILAWHMKFMSSRRINSATTALTVMTTWRQQPLKLWSNVMNHLDHNGQQACPPAWLHIFKSQAIWTSGHSMLPVDHNHFNLLTGYFLHFLRVMCRRSYTF